MTRPRVKRVRDLLTDQEWSNEDEAAQKLVGHSLALLDRTNRSRAKELKDTTDKK